MTSSPTTTSINDRVGRRRKWLFLAFLGALFLVVGAPLTGYLFVGESVAQTQQAQVAPTNPLSGYWRAVRQGQEGVSTVQGPQANILINTSGETFRQVRNGPLATYGAWLMALTLLILALLYLVRGPVQLDHGRKGLTVERWTLFDRVLHWYTAVLFILLAITGLSLLFGRMVLIPLLGPQGFAGFAGFAMLVHNYLGPLFAVGLLVMVIKWLRVNIPKGHDLGWFLSGGGLLKGKHPHAGFVNAGEKLLFWTLATVGMAVVVTGLILDFPLFGLSREAMQISLLLHAAGSILIISFIFGHIYLATLAMKGSLEGMVGGRVDVNWARQHHDLWMEELERKGVRPEPAVVKEPPAPVVDKPQPAQT